MGKRAKVRVSWSQSPSQNITRQVIRYALDGGPVVELETSNDILETTIDMAANSSIFFEHTTYKLVGGVEQSATASISFSVGDLEMPVAVQSLTAEVVQIYDEEPTDPDTPVDPNQPEPPIESSFRRRR